MVAEDIVAFGPFELNRTRRSLARQGTTIAVRSRAMGILLALTEQAGAIVSNRELLKRVWSNVVVQSGTVRVHVAQLRTVLRNADAGSEYIHNVTGHGYRFVVPVVARRPSRDAAVIELLAPTRRKLLLAQPVRKNNVPKLLAPVFGREQAGGAIVERSVSERFVTVTGAGGIGKTTAAIVAAEALAATHADGVCFLDLAVIERPQETWSQLARLLGVSEAADLQAQTLACLARQSLLLVLDNCDQVVESAARVAESVIRHCPQVTILATSREPLRASGEVVYELMPLGVPSMFEQPSRDTFMHSPAIRLFIERAGAEFNEAELWWVLRICRRLAGNPLAIEIAAGQFRWLGLKGLAAGLDDKMYLSMEGRRTAQRRHRTLRASFDWSYGLMSNEEQAIFCRLSQLPDRFTAAGAAAVISDEQLSRRLVMKCLRTLARRSLVVIDTSREEVLYGMHDLTRAYARMKLHQTQQIALRRARVSHIHRLACVELTHALTESRESPQTDMGWNKRLLTTVSTLGGHHRHGS